MENIFFLQCLRKEIATAKELDMRPLGRVIIFRDKQTRVGKVGGVFLRSFDLLNSMIYDLKRSVDLR